MTKYVQVSTMMPPGHVRTPSYLRGKIGVIERDLGNFANPEEQAYRHKATQTPVLRVRFTMAEIWGADAENPADTLDAEIFAHWLTEVDERNAS